MAKKRRQFVLLGPERAPGDNQPLGSLAEVRHALSRFNTATDGAAPRGATEMLHGPGFVVELALGIDPVSQVIASINDEDIAFPVLMRVCRELKWRLMDVETGRILG